jgi:hypothetical protein
MATAFKRGLEFPHECFVQNAVETHFKTLGFQHIAAGYADFACEHPKAGVSWVIEAKGLTSAVGLDFRTGLGQLLQRMTIRDVHYGIAIPEIPQFLAQCRRVPQWVRESLNLHWVIVRDSGEV